MSAITIRVRTQLGTWRVASIKPSDTFANIRSRLEEEHIVDLKGIPFTADPSGSQVYDDHITSAEAKLTNGHMLYAMIDETKVSVHDQSTGHKKIKKDGTIVNQDVSSVFQSSGFRPGMLPLRSMKMHWTINEFVSLDEQFQYKIQAQKESNCKLLSIDKASIENFQSYMRNFDFNVMRVGFLYGKFNEDTSVSAELIYEPPQETTDTSFALLEDPREEIVEGIAGMLGLTKVGWIFSHPTREKGFHFSGAEIMFAAEQQLEAAQGVGDTPFVTMKLTIDETSQISVEAYQVSKQCMEMVAEGVVSPNAVNLGAVDVNETFTAIVEGRESKEIDNNFFLASTPIEQFESQFLVVFFPRVNRIDNMQTRDDIKTQLQKVGKQGWTFSDVLADFQLLLYLCEFMSIQDDLPRICKAITDREVPLDDGYQLLIRSIAGMD
eukprot:CAMPEP_0174969530 /NCGR_PEP_ID=MMETSP0004_2-20121128/8816_1 /TAXON_ID=420556 /ORGANISM="Ochromonas sp., Strain CCMP1393" /LENGTH=436 /DNA_ID=CAMNT_0016219035 /DNA_START=117 /DNA_END=1428 /DNA_ORIENTATION=-